jgi:hypothetical protein
MKKEFYESNYKYNSKMDGLKAPDIICRSQNNEEKLLSLFVKDKPVLIFRQVDKICISCKSEDIKILFDFIKKNTTSAVILCASHQREDIDILIKQKMVEIPVYDISSNAFNWNLDDGYNPYYFVLHPDMKISNIYVPGKSFPEMNKAYLESVKRLLAD